MPEITILWHPCFTIDPPHNPAESLTGPPPAHRASGIQSKNRGRGNPIAALAARNSRFFAASAGLTASVMPVDPAMTPVRPVAGNPDESLVPPAPIPRPAIVRTIADLDHNSSRAGGGRHSNRCHTNQRAQKRDKNPFHNSLSFRIPTVSGRLYSFARRSTRRLRLVPAGELDRAICRARGSSP
jgi:hypothetical protein